MVMRVVSMDDGDSVGNADRDRPGRRLRTGLVAGLIGTAIFIAGCGESEGGNGSNLSKGEKYGIAQEVIEEAGFSEHAAEKARELGEREGLSPAETSELGGIAKHMK